MFNRTIRRAAVPAILLLAVSAAGCGSKPTTPAGTPAPTSTPVATQPVQPASTPKETLKEAKIKAYYSDTDLTKLVEKETSISYAADADKYKLALQKLQAAPDTTVLPLMKGITIQSAKLENSQVTVNMTISDQGRLGSPGEALLLDALKKTLFQFSEVQTIELLVDGKQTESLMGHMDVPHPMKR
ncbi:GerMN domain-containing protein [Paenibacillus sp. HJGM_3]|uniref:GerMN domain-containing protein n=1 Tax=Paenibacillus sp. HJGM_3 TaxID=3379816 RepID=UPI00385E829A